MTIIHLTNSVVDAALLKEYNKQQGIFAAPIYAVPTYVMKVEGLRDLEVIRVGLSRANSHMPANRRNCNVGIFKKQTVNHPEWDNDYTPATAAGSIPGAVRVWPEKGFLIHEGPSNRRLAMGTYGCVEVLGTNHWKDFVDYVKPLALKRQIQLKFDLLNKVEAVLAVQTPDLKRIWGAALHDRVKNSVKSGNELTDDEVDQLLTTAAQGAVSPVEILDLQFIAVNYSKSAVEMQKMIDFIKAHATPAAP